MKIMKISALLLAMASANATSGTVSFRNASSGGDTLSLTGNPSGFLTGTIDVVITQSTNDPFSSLDIIFASDTVMFESFSFSPEFLMPVFTFGTFTNSDQTALANEFKISGASLSNNMAIGEFGFNVGTLTIIAPGDIGTYTIFVDSSLEANGVSKIGVIGGTPDPLFGYTTVIVPEPTTLILLGLGAVVVLRSHRRAA